MCDAQTDLSDGGLLNCTTPGVSHEWHYDELEDVTWKKGRPDD